MIAGDITIVIKQKDVNNATRLRRMKSTRKSTTPTKTLMENGNAYKKV